MTGLGFGLWRHVGTISYIRFLHIKAYSRVAWCYLRVSNSCVWLSDPVSSVEYMSMCRKIQYYTSRPSVSLRRKHRVLSCVHDCRCRRGRQPLVLLHLARRVEDEGDVREDRGDVQQVVDRELPRNEVLAPVLVAERQRDEAPPG